VRGEKKKGRRDWIGLHMDMDMDMHMDMNRG
jgi:hypothetical protein